MPRIGVGVLLLGESTESLGEGQSPPLAKFDRARSASNARTSFAFFYLSPFGASARYQATPCGTRTSGVTRRELKVGRMTLM